MTDPIKFFNKVQGMADELIADKPALTEFASTSYADQVTFLSMIARIHGCPRDCLGSVVGWMHGYLVGKGLVKIEQANPSVQVTE